MVYTELIPYIEFLLFAAAPAVVVGLAVELDMRTRRGYGLGLLAVLMLALDVWGVGVLSQAIQQTNAEHTDNLVAGIVVGAYILIGLYLTLVLMLGGIAEAVVARQRLWIAVIVMVSLLPAALILAFGTAVLLDILGRLGLSPGVEFIVVLFPPPLGTLTYSVVRTVRPVAVVRDLQ